MPTFSWPKLLYRYMKEGGRIINTTSVTAYKGNPMLLDYSSTKGAIVAFTRSLALSLAEPGHPGERSGPRSHLDTAHSSLFQGREG